MTKLWQKSGTKLHPLVEQYTVGDDYILDNILMPYDIQATKAHIKGLGKIKILKKGEVSKLIARLNKLEKEFKQGKVKIRVQDEDCHTVIENYVTKKFKKLGGKIHTGRSRNDQVLVALRLYLRDEGKKIHKQAKKLAKSFLQFAEKYQNIPIPGYTHTQQAMLSSVGHYACSFVESLIDDIDFLKNSITHIDKNPLGSAAGFGVPLLLDREFTTKELKFKKTQINSIYCQGSRGKFESAFLEGIAQIMMTLGRFANDLILFTTQEFNFFEIKNNLTTGSSIMPQKKNLDAMEILRGNVSVIINNQNLIKNITKNLNSTYNRDLQLIKKPLMESIAIVLSSMTIVELYLKGIKPNEKEIISKISPEIFMADIATEIAKSKKIPFRAAYKQAYKELKNATASKSKSSKKYQEFFKILNPKENIKLKISLGAPGNLDMNYYKNQLRKI